MNQVINILKNLSMTDDARSNRICPEKVPLGCLFLRRWLPGTVRCTEAWRTSREDRCGGSLREVPQLPSWIGLSYFIPGGVSESWVWPGRLPLLDCPCVCSFLGETHHGQQLKSCKTEPWRRMQLRVSPPNKEKTKTKKLQLQLKRARNVIRSWMWSCLKKLGEKKW